MDYKNIVIEGSDLIDDYHKFRSVTRFYSFNKFERKSIRIITQSNGCGTPLYAKKFANEYKLPIINCNPDYRNNGPLAWTEIFEYEANIGDLLITIIGKVKSKYTYLIDIFNNRSKPIIIYNFIDNSINKLNY